MRLWTIKALVTLAVFTSVGGHWAVLQGIAWTGMLVEYSVADGSLIKAVTKTFDGEHPCKMCLSITEGKQEESKEKNAAPNVSFDKIVLSKPTGVPIRTFVRCSPPRPADTTFPSSFPEPSVPVPLSVS